MKYLLFNYSSNGLMHNVLYENLFVSHDSISQIIEDEGTLFDISMIPSFSELVVHFKSNDDFIFKLSDGGWFHLQELTTRNYIKE